MHLGRDARSLGAVAQLKDSSAVVLSWPYELDSADVVDTTGAGDAFIAGVLAYSLNRGLCRAADLKTAVEQGMLWGRLCLHNRGWCH